MKRFTTFSLATLAATACVGLSVSAAAASADSLVGNGSTLVAPLVTSVWGPDFKSSTGTQVTYGAVGSGTGITDITNHVGDFGASDAPLSAAQQSACSDCVQIPWALSATGVAYNLPGIKVLKLNGPVLANIFLGTVTTWNDPSIAKLNPGVKLPALKITPVVRSDGSGDTYAFTDFLSRVSPTFKTTALAGGPANTLANWPSSVTSGKGNAGVAAVVTATPGAIGYVSAFYIRNTGLSEAQIQNASGNYEYAYDNTIEDAATAFTTIPANFEMHIVNPPAAPKVKKGQKQKPVAAAYPISTYTYVIVHKNSSQAATLSKFIQFAVNEPASKIANYTFAPLPAAVKTAALKAAAGL